MPRGPSSREATRVSCSTALLSLLQTRRRWRGIELAAKPGVSVRTVRSDVERLRTLGYEVDASPGVSGRYQLRPGATLPPLQLDDDEAVAVSVGLRMSTGAGMADLAEHSDRAAAKLQQLFPARLRHRLRMINDAIEPLTSTRQAVGRDVFTAVASAIERREQLRF